jgi:hypothetical protein
MESHLDFVYEANNEFEDEHENGFERVKLLTKKISVKTFLLKTTM